VNIQLSFIFSAFWKTLIFTTLSDPNSLLAQMVQLVVFQLVSIQTSLNSNYRLLSHTATSLHHSVARPRENQEPPRMLLSPFEMGSTPSPLLSEMEALNNSAHC
jgi:hypothetical protein